jgi:hypothetical protein
VPAPGTQVALLDGPLVEVIKVAAPWAHLNVAVEFYGSRIRALQLVHADKRECWPWDGQYQGVRGGQPVLGAREPPERRIRVG